MIDILTGRHAVSSGRRANHDYLHFAKRAFSAFAIAGFLLSIALFLTSTTSGLLAVAVLAWSSLYLAVVFGLDERHRWGQILAIAILIIQPLCIGKIYRTLWQIGAVFGLAAMPMVRYLSMHKVSRLLY